MASVVFDASAVLVLLRNEPGADVVARHAGNAMMSAVNIQEVIEALLQRGIPLDAARELVAALHLDIRPHGRDEAVAAAALYPITNQYGSGLGDRSCMALAIAEGLPAVTADREWSKLDIAGLRIPLAR